MNKEEGIKQEIKKLASEFGLKYKPEWFNYIWISPRENALLEYVGECPDPIYVKYGKTSRKRIKNIDKFVNSEDFRKCLKRFGGQVISREDSRKYEEHIGLIHNKKLKQKLLKILGKIKKRLGKAKVIALMTSTNIKKWRKWLMKSCLRHEWLHVLVRCNKIRFQDIDKKFWPYDEGIVEYFGAFIDGKLYNLEEMTNKVKYAMEHKYFVYAIRFKELFKDRKTPKEKKQALLGLIKKLK
jgi:hypothetical protein